MSETRGRGPPLAWPGTAKGHAPGGRWDRTRTPRGAVTYGLCRVVVRACKDEATTRQEARRGRGGQKNNERNPAATQEGEKRRASRRRGDRVGQTGSRETAGCARKKRQKQQRQVNRWGKGKGNGGRGRQEGGTTTGPEGSTPPKRKKAGRERTVLVRSQAGCRSSWPGPRGCWRPGGVKTRDAGKKGTGQKRACGWGHTTAPGRLGRGRTRGEGRGG